MKKAALIIFSLTIAITGVTLSFNACNPDSDNDYGPIEVYEDGTYKYTPISCEPVTRVTFLTGAQNQEAYEVNLSTGVFSSNNVNLGQVNQQILNSLLEVFESSCSCNVELLNTQDLYCTQDIKFPFMTVLHNGNQSVTYIDNCYERTGLCENERAQELRLIQNEFTSQHLNTAF